MEMSCHVEKVITITVTRLGKKLTLRPNFQDHLQFLRFKFEVRNILGKFLGMLSYFLIVLNAHTLKKLLAFSSH